MQLTDLVNEGILKLTTAQMRQLDALIDILKSKFPLNEKGYDVKTLIDKMTDITWEYHNKTNQFPYITFYYDESSKEYAYYHRKNPHDININLAPLSFRDQKKIKNVIWGKVKAKIIHEWIHKKQYIRGGATGADAQQHWEYFNQPREMMPWAAMEVEELKSLLRTADPDRILRILKRLGLTDPSLKKLKQTNHKSWRRIMKNAILYALATSPQVK